jgi:flagellar hook-associated protein 1 FlgK
MSGLYGTLNLGTRALQAQSKGLSIAGQNLANVNNPAYSRQRLVVQTSTTLPTSLGPQGTGVSAISIQRVHDELLDRQIRGEASSTGFWNSQQQALGEAQAGLGEALGSGTQGTNGTSATAGVASLASLGSDLSALFAEFQSLAATPASLTQRSTLVARAQTLADQFHRTDARLDGVEKNLNQSVQSGVGQANELLAAVARLNDQIRRAETSTGGTANDLRDRRQEKLEALAVIAPIDTFEDADGQMSLALGGEVLVTGKQVLATLTTQDSGNGRLQVQTSTGSALTLTGGSLQGTIDIRDGALAGVQTDLDRLAATLASEVNTLHRAGFNLDGGTGADFFTGSTAADLRVNAQLVSDPSLIQASGNPAAVGDNRIALEIARLAERPLDALGNRTLSASYAQTVTSLGENLANANSQVEDQQLVSNLLAEKRNATSGVSIDEEMADLVKYQKAFQASARIVSIVDQMLDEVIQLKR